MNEYQVTSIKQTINLEPTTVVEEILQNVRFIITSYAFSCPMDRDFTWSPEELDGPINVVKARIRAKLAEAIPKYEPRAELLEVLFKTDNALEGNLIPIVRVRIDETKI
ncbi:hypothetical protein ACNQFZ_18540 [Schinkia sp. CFF1]